MLQLSGNRRRVRRRHERESGEDAATTLVGLGRGDVAVLTHIDLPGDDARRLMELGFLPGARITVGLSAPGGDPRVFQVDGSEIALRLDTARRMRIERADEDRAEPQGTR
jgi:ferrous iron transport protein A